MQSQSSHRWTFPSPADAASSSPASHQQLLAGAESAIRNRFSVIKGYSQLLDRALERHPGEHERMQTYSAALNQEMTSFHHLLEQYFSAARLQWDTTALAWHAVDLGQLAEQVVTRFDDGERWGSSHGVRLETSDAVQGIWDARWLSEAVAAVVANALTYSPDGSEVHLTIRRQNDHAVVIVTDAGSGINPDERETIFEPFVRGAAALENGADGWGLGLFIASRTVIAHGGWLEIESQPGHGSQVMLHLPLIPVPRLAA